MASVLLLHRPSCPQSVCVCRAAVLLTHLPRLQLGKNEQPACTELPPPPSHTRLTSFKHNKTSNCVAIV